MPLLPLSLTALQPFTITMTLLTFLLQRTRLLPALLALETLALLAVFSTNILLGPTTQAHTFLILIILSFSAMEASMGLALMVSLARTKGSDMLLSMTPFKC